MTKTTLTTCADCGVERKPNENHECKEMRAANRRAQRAVQQIADHIESKTSRK